MWQHAGPGSANGSLAALLFARPAPVFGCATTTISSRMRDYDVCRRGVHRYRGSDNGSSVRDACSPTQRDDYYCDNDYERDDQDDEQPVAKFGRALDCCDRPLLRMTLSVGLSSVVTPLHQRSSLAPTWSERCLKRVVFNVDWMDICPWTLDIVERATQTLGYCCTAAVPLQAFHEAMWDISNTGLSFRPELVCYSLVEPGSSQQGTWGDGEAEGCRPGWSRRAHLVWPFSMSAHRARGPRERATLRLWSVSPISHHAPSAALMTVVLRSGPRPRYPASAAPGIRPGQRRGRRARPAPVVMRWLGAAGGVAGSLT